MELWINVFGEPAPKPASEKIAGADLEEHLSMALQRQFPDMPWEVETLSQQEHQEMERVASSPEVCGRIDATTWGSIIRPRG